MQSTTTVSHTIETNSVLRNTYMLLSLTMVMTAVTAYFGTLLHLGVVGNIAVIVGSLLALLAVHICRNSGWGVFWVFVFTGLEGLSLGPVLQHHLALQNGAIVVSSAAGLTALLFASLSGYAIISGKNFSFMGGMLLMGLIGLVLVSLFGIFFPSPLLHLVCAYAGVLIFSGYVLYDTSNIIHGGETNYIRATVSLYLDIVNLFFSFMRILRD